MFRLFMVVCIVMQIIVMLPHHHHGESSLACVNPFHCSSVDKVAQEEHAGHGHSGCCGHETAPVDDRVESCACGGPMHKHDNGDPGCYFNHMDIVISGRSTQEIQPVVTCQPAGLAITLLARTHDILATRSCRSASENLSFRDYSTPASYTDYCAVAIPPRAPSFTV